MEIIQNDTFGDMSRDELNQLRQSAHKCSLCGMLADVDPTFHQARYGHAPQYYDGSSLMRWAGRSQKWVEVKH